MGIYEYHINIWNFSLPLSKRDQSQIISAGNLLIILAAVVVTLLVEFSTFFFTNHGYLDGSRDQGNDHGGEI